MKIKWKIMLAINLLLLVMIIVVNLQVRNEITDIVGNKTLNELKNYSEMGLSLLNSHYPGDWELKGDKLYKGDTLINNNYDVVDELSEDTGILATIFANKTRISTTVKDQSGKRMVNTDASEKVLEKVIKNNESYNGTADVANQKADTYYVPLQDKDGNPVGMWFVGIYSTVVEKEISQSMLNITIGLIIIMLLGSIATYFLGLYMSKGYTIISKELKRLENGDFNVQFSQSLFRRKDEFGEIIRSFENMQKKVRGIICSIKDETLNIHNLSSVLADGTDNVYRDIENISATTQELSAGMEETAASTEEMNATSVSIEEEIIRVTDQVKSGQIIASEIKERAEALKLTALQSEEEATTVYDGANKKLRQSIEKAASINKISALSKTILDITAQTNLLALNASIESARAGEAGKGFAVVANEIAKLAQNSKDAVSQIEVIANDISDTVKDIVEDSKQLLKFMDTKVIKDYGVLVHTGEQYNSDANVIESMINDIKNSAVQLNESIIYIRKAIDEVTVASQEGSKGSSEIAEKSTSIFHKTNEVLEATNKNKEIADSLNRVIQFFKL